MWLLCAHAAARVCAGDLRLGWLRLRRKELPATSAPGLGSLRPFCTGTQLPLHA